MILYVRRNDEVASTCLFCNINTSLYFLQSPGKRARVTLKQNGFIISF